MSFLLIPSEALKEYAEKISGLSDIVITYNNLDEDSSTIAYANVRNKSITIDPYNVTHYRDPDIVQKAYFFHELGHFFNYSMGCGAAEFGAHFWAIKHTYYLGLETINRYLHKILTGWGNIGRKDPKDIYYIAHKIGRKLAII